MPIIIPESQCSVVTEAYYGKPKEFLKSEKLLVPIIDAINAEYDINNHSKTDRLVNGKYHINACKELRDVEKNINSVFKFGNLSITFYGASIEFDIERLQNIANGDASGDDYLFSIQQAHPNAFTPIVVLTDIKQKLLGKKFSNDDINATIFIDKSLIAVYQLTPQELMAIILHEIGHNLDHSIFKIIAHTLPSPKEIIKIADGKTEEITGFFIGRYIIGPVLQKFYGNFLQIYYALLEQLKINAEFNKMMNLWFKTVHQIINFARQSWQMAIIVTGKLDVNALIMDIINPSVFFGYAGEKYADSIATSYGYGVETANVHRKVQQGGNTFINKIPVVNVVNDLMKTTVGIVTAYADPHPEAALRVLAQIKKLRRDLNDPTIPKEMRKEIEAQIADLETICDDMSSVRKNANNGMIFSALYNAVLIKFFKGYSDPRELLELIWRHEE